MTNDNDNNNNYYYYYYCAKEAILRIALPPNCCNFGGKNFKVEFDSLNLFQGTCRLKCNNNMRTMKLSTCFSA